MGAVITYRHFKKHDEIFMGMNLFALIGLILSALSLFYIAISFKLAINSPLLLFLAIVWMIITSLMIKATSNDEVQGFYSSIFTHTLSDHIYALRSTDKRCKEEPCLEELLGLEPNSDYITNAEQDLIAVISLENGLHWLTSSEQDRDYVCNNWARFLAQMQSTTQLKNYFATNTNHGDTVQAFVHISNYGNLECAQKQQEQWLQELISKHGFIPEYKFYLIIKHKIQNNKNHPLILWLRKYIMRKHKTKENLGLELSLLKQKCELSLINLRALGIVASQLKDNKLAKFYEKYHPSFASTREAHDKGKYIELGSKFYQCMRLSTAPDSGDLKFWLTELLGSLKTESLLSISWTHRDAYQDRRRAEQKAEIVRQLAKGSRSSTQAIISENQQIASDLINQPQSYDLNIAIAVINSDLDELQKQSLKIVKPYRGARLASLDRQQISNYLSVLPFASTRLSSRAQLYASNNFAGACFPFLKNELGTKSGALMGLSLENSRPIFLDEYDRSVCHNRSINYIGDSGSGKTVAAKLAVKRRIERGGSFVIIDNTTDGWQFFVDYYGGKTIEIDSAASPDGMAYFAPLELGDNPSSSEINNQIERVVRLLSLIKNRSSEISAEEEFFLVRSLTKLYETTLKPSLSDLHEYLSKQSYNPVLAEAYQRAIAPYCRCTQGIYAGLMDGSSARISNQEKLLLVTLSKVESDTNYLPVALFLIMNYVSQRVVFKRETALTLIVDEAWKIFTGTKAKQGRDSLSFFARAGRGMDLGLWTISQKPQDLPREVHSSASCTLCFQLKENSDKLEMAAAAGLKVSEAKLLEHSALNEPGNCFLKTTRSSGLLQVVMDPTEAVISNSTRDFATKRELIFKQELKSSRTEAALKTVKILVS